MEYEIKKYLDIIYDFNYQILYKIDDKQFYIIEDYEFISIFFKEEEFFYVIDIDKNNITDCIYNSKRLEKLNSVYKQKIEKLEENKLKDISKDEFEKNKEKYFELANDVLIYLAEKSKYKLKFLLKTKEKLWEM